jgi:hypothetical protein
MNGIRRFPKDASGKGKPNNYAIRTAKSGYHHHFEKNSYDSTTTLRGTDTQVYPKLTRNVPKKEDTKE